MSRKGEVVLKTEWLDLPEFVKAYRELFELALAEQKVAEIEDFNKGLQAWEQKERADFERDLAEFVANEEKDDKVREEKI